MRTRVKLCGITSLEDAQTALDFGAHALGFRIGEGPGELKPEQIRPMVRVLAPYAVLVGVCPHRPAMELRELLRHCQLDIAQLAEAATIDDCRLLRQRFRVIKQLGFPPATGLEVMAKAILALAPAVDGVLLDGRLLLAAGSTPPDREKLQALTGTAPPILLSGVPAGDLKQLLQHFRPYALDGGPELDEAAALGRKDWHLVRQFLRAVRRETRQPLP